MSAGRKDDKGKLRWHLLRKGCVHALEGVIRVLMYGEKKYGAHNWKDVADAEQRYRDALDRHLADIDRGIEFDPDTGEDNWFHVATNALFVAELRAAKRLYEPVKDVETGQVVAKHRERRWWTNTGTRPYAVIGNERPIDLQFRGGQIMESVSPIGWRWGLDGADGDIINWRHSA